MPGEPLIFVEVALTAEVPGSIQNLLSEDRAPLEAEAAEVATFYSISNCQKGLKGISFGNLLIKQVASELALAYPRLARFVTLSPLPGFNRWLGTQTTDDGHGAAARAVLDGSAPDAILRRMAARYLLTARRADGSPADPVARFHLGNGAEVHAVHAGADTSDNGSAQSSGAMVNYLYDLGRVEKNHAAFALRGQIVASRAVQGLAAAVPSQPSRETTP
jgi:malonyl-CoA decarboxylase